MELFFEWRTVILQCGYVPIVLVLIVICIVKIGTLLSSDAKILLISKVGKEGEALQRMARIGYTNVSISCALFVIILLMYR